MSTVESSPTHPARGRVLVSGASIAGLCSAFWLDRAGYVVTLIEAAEAFRDGGQNVDVRGVAREVLDRMGLTGAVQAATTTEEGTAFVDGQGRRVAAFPAADHPEGKGLTAELEILRGDLAVVLRDALPDGVTLRFGERIAAVRQDHDGVDVTLVSGRVERYDLLVVAEGVGSSTRGLVFGAVEERRLGVTCAYGTIPRAADDDRWWRWYFAPGARNVSLRPDPHGTTRAMLCYADSRGHAESRTEGDAEGDRRALFEVFAGAGWQTERILRGLEASADLYVDRLRQIRMPSWSRGRVVVVGDAAWCVTPLGGGGSSLALVGGYVLAAFLAHSPQEVSVAFARYDAWMRPLVASVQDLPPGVPRLAYPRTRLGISALHTGMRVAASPAVRRLSSRLGRVAGRRERRPDLPSAP